jgi:hypothetical protein
MKSPKVRIPSLDIGLIDVLDSMVQRLLTVDFLDTQGYLAQFSPVLVGR